jgi:hypothetical protein
MLWAEISVVVFSCTPLPWWTTQYCDSNEHKGFRIYFQVCRWAIVCPVPILFLKSVSPTLVCPVILIHLVSFMLLMPSLLSPTFFLQLSLRVTLVVPYSNLMIS